MTPHEIAKQLDVATGSAQYGDLHREAAQVIRTLAAEKAQAEQERPSARGLNVNGEPLTPAQWDEEIRFMRCRSVGESWTGEDNAALDEVFRRLNNADELRALLKARLASIPDEDIVRVADELSADQLRTQLACENSSSPDRGPDDVA